ncbi:MAG: hypothetical protein Q4G27_05445 [Flavobacteriaceae bacterium]|nr:hypothetical protein [Flavobacteriaceae bacterium]
MKVEEINNLVKKGKLPIAYFNSEIIEMKKSTFSSFLVKGRVNNFYRQVYLRKSHTKCISKIYEIS